VTGFQDFSGCPGLIMKNRENPVRTDDRIPGCSGLNHEKS
jgi:hypothetical protein